MWDGKNILLTPEKSTLTFIQGTYKKNQHFCFKQTKPHLPPQDLTKIPVPLWVRNVRNKLTVKKTKKKVVPTHTF